METNYLENIQIFTIKIDRHNCISAILLFILYNNKWTETVRSEVTVTTEIHDTSTSTPLHSKATTLNPSVVSKPYTGDFKSTASPCTSSKATRGQEAERITAGTNNGMTVENKTGAQGIGLKSTTDTTPDITTSIIEYTQAPSDWKDPELLTLLFNLNVTYCQENMCWPLTTPLTNCRCDDLCYFYEDCCYSMIEKLTRSREINTNTSKIAPLINQKVREMENSTLMLRKDLTTCVGNKNNEFAFIMVSKCDVRSMASKDVIEKCESSSMMYSIHNIPVDHTVNGKIEGTFKNVYCALCNGVSENETEFWRVDIICSRRNAWLILQMEIEEIEQQEICMIIAYSLYKDSLRKCYIGENYIEKCDQTHMGDIKSLCQSYVYPVISVHTTKSPIYKNPHCVLCHHKNVDVRDFQCAYLYPEYMIPEFDWKPSNSSDIDGLPVNLQVVFDFSRERGIVQKVKCVELVKCAFYEIYDCVSKRCRQLYCQRGETPLEGKCIKVANVTSGVTEKPVIDTVKPIDNFFTSVNVLRASETYILELSSDKIANSVLYAMGDTSDTILKTIHNAIISIYQDILESHQTSECLCLKIKIIYGEYDVELIAELFTGLILYFNKLEEQEKRGYSLIPLFIKFRNFQSLDNVKCATGKLIIDTNPSVITANASISSSSISNNLFLLPTYDIVVYEQNSMYEMIYDTSFGVVPNVVATCDNSPKLNCSMLAYEVNEVSISNTSVKVINTSLTFQQDEFAIFQNKVFVCSDRIINLGSFVNIFGFSASHKVLSLVTSALSVFCAAIVVVVHCCLRRLRNIHGLNLSALSTSTILMHLLLIIAHFIEGQTLCLVYAVSLHFVVLNIFVWMSIIGFDVNRNFSSDKLIPRSFPLKRFIGYCFLSLAFPTLIIIVSVSLDFTDSRF